MNEERKDGVILRRELMRSSMDGGQIEISCEHSNTTVSYVSQDCFCMLVVEPIVPYSWSARPPKACTPFLDAMSRRYGRKPAGLCVRINTCLFALQIK